MNNPTTPPADDVKSLREVLAEKGIESSSAHEKRLLEAKLIQRILSALQQRSDHPAGTGA